MIRAGEIFIVSGGEYSDYSVCAAMRAKVDFEAKAIQTDYCAAMSDRRNWDNQYPLAGWLVRAGLAEEVPLIELHAGWEQFVGPDDPDVITETRTFDGTDVPRDPVAPAGSG